MLVVFFVSKHGFRVWNLPEFKEAKVSYSSI